MLLRQDVTYSHVARVIHQKEAPAGVWGYGKYWEKPDAQGNLQPGWSGTKGLWMTPAWCEEIGVLLENTNFEHYQHVDMWLVRLMKQQKAQGFEIYPVLAGYGHRVSMSTSAHGVQKFGGCWLPDSPHDRPMSLQTRNDYIFQYAPRGLREWVQACRRCEGGESGMCTRCCRTCSC